MAFEYQLDLVESVGEAQQRLESHAKFDVVVTDLALPDSTGLNTFRRIRLSTGSGLPIVVLSGRSDESTAIEAVSEGAQDYITKDKMSTEILSRSLRYAIERSARQQMDRELHGAAQVQQRLLPTTSPNVPGFDIAGLSVAASLAGGDYFDYIPMEGPSLAIAVGDVCGHGIAPALIMVETRAYLRSLVNGRPSIGNALDRINQLLFQEFHAERFISLILFHLDYEAKTVEYVGCGHDAHIIRANGDVEHLHSTGVVLAILDGVKYGKGSVELRSGDTLLALTDGVTEAMGKEEEQFGIDRALDFVKHHQELSSLELVEGLFHKSREFTEFDYQNDDVTAVVVKAL